ncbi:hypothetical protein OPKNFCMD_1656 [Methylobacterium crusticola]|uniref:DUF1275 domain-containing protein n=1 Tax=Methylobacterium crusticola TaxID=1697972 RepID=A0ABQ4QUB7_9HYPH|nr:YoaK family protein [Methylobacterium crusticola]GJD48930.1 hypothetical protein OPKNFCMD_1656 [Methylobacterium crusticola]
MDREAPGRAPPGDAEPGEGRARRGVAVVVGLLLTAMAGYVDAVGFLRLDGLYTSFMSGNTTQLAVTLVRPQAGVALEIGLLLAAFVAGGLAGSLAAILVPERWATAAVLAAEAAALLLALATATALPEPRLAAPLLAAAMGAQNAALGRVAGFRPGVTFVTGTLFALSHGLALAFARRGPALGWLPDACTWAALLAGAAGGSAAYLSHGLLALALPAAGITALLAASLALAAWPAAGGRAGPGRSAAPPG